MSARAGWLRVAISLRSISHSLLCTAFNLEGFGQSYWSTLVPILGILVSVLWYQIIQSHRDLNTVKFQIIHQLEEHLPVALYAYEWQLAGEGRGTSYSAVTHIEQGIPIAFVVLHIILFLSLLLVKCGFLVWLQ